MCAEAIIEEKMATLEFYSDLPGLTVNGPRDSALEVYLDEDLAENLKRSVAKLVINVRPDVLQSKIEIGNFKGRIVISVKGNNSNVSIGKCGNLNLDINLYRNSSVEIGDVTTCNNASLVVMDSAISIGRDCMISHDVVFQSCDQHGIVDLETMEIINNKRSIHVRDHVWLGKGVFLCAGVEIEQGSIIAAKSVVSKNIPQFVLAGGCPAKVIRAGVSWSRDLDRIDNRSANFINSRR